MTTISLADVIGVFDALIAGRISREVAADWAEKLRQTHDAGELVFAASDDKETIWRAILYLIGVDLKISPTKYLHKTRDFVVFRSTINL